MTFDDTRDNTTAIEANLSEADAREEAREADHIHNSRHIRLVEERHPEHNDGANGYDEGPTGTMTTTTTSRKMTANRPNTSSGRISWVATIGTTANTMTAVGRPFPGNR